MKKCIFRIFFSCIFMQSLHAAMLWECSISVDNKILKKFTSEYEKKASNMALEMCKKESIDPLACHNKNILCEAFVDGVSITPLWECSAFDAQSNAFTGNNSTIKDEAAMNAKDVCRSKSSLPETCYVHLVACLNKHEIAP